MSDQSDKFWADQLQAMYLAAAAYNSAIIAFATSNISSYQLDTGQTRQLVTRGALSTLRGTLDSLLNDIAVLEARLCGTGTLTMVPGF